MHGIFTLILVSPLLTLSYNCENITVNFPSNFIFATSTSAYQIEGGWNEDGKSPSVWDTFTHKRPEKIFDHSNGDISVDSYNLFKKDVEALKSIGFQQYRFSISWPRIVINGTKVNIKGIDYYNKLINDLLRNNIEPVVTMFHWDLPQYLQDLGGFTNPLIVNYFEYYANILFENFGDRVKTWITINEPMTFCIGGYSEGRTGPAVEAPGIGEYLCGHYSLLSHAAAYRLYKNKFYEQQKGEIGLSLNLRYSYPKDDSVNNSYVNQVLDFTNGWLLNPIFGDKGNYPEEMIELFKRKSVNEQMWSRLPIYSKQEIENLQGSADFLGVNYYTSRLAAPKNSGSDFSPFFDNDINVEFHVDESWIKGSTNWMYVVPEGLYDLLIWIREKYKNPKVFITENGFPDLSGINDVGRINYVKHHLLSVSRAIKSNCNVVGYTYWSLLDNFEWSDGYTQKFGLFYVNISSESKDRVPKSSAQFFKELIKNRKFTM
ncbi:unnamed protein product [Chironomus riparius]|uniref:Beta-glucosidase n=1 Tax=Chironomus riparius TaxID=315576 RepID=A0A9N9S1Q6_9DIPT|nr:unnamed protein product [Chironomus riparius]